MNIPRRRYWPYDEVRASRDSSFPGRFIIVSPWLTFHIDIEEKDVERTERLARKIAEEKLSPADFDEINWFFSALSQYPLAYTLPRAGSFGTDSHSSALDSNTLISPHAALSTVEADAASRDTIAANSGVQIAALANDVLKDETWTWDIDASLQFSKVTGGHDPESLFSVARRFHLLNDIEWNETGELLDYVSSLKHDPSRFKFASAFIARQNHYITERCEDVLSTALPSAQDAAEAVQEFMRAESGHDKIIAKAIRSLGFAPQDLPLVDSTFTLMEVFRFAARTNFLAFSMITDVFERSSYQKDDPFATVLTAGGESVAAAQIDAHRDINDAGGHENVAVGFLSGMKPVSQDYAVQALRLAELATLVIHQVSIETLRRLREA